MNRSVCQHKSSYIKCIDLYQKQVCLCILYSNCCSKEQQLSSWRMEVSANNLGQWTKIHSWRKDVPEQTVWCASRGINTLVLLVIKKSVPDVKSPFARNTNQNHFYFYFQFLFEMRFLTWYILYIMQTIIRQYELK